MPKIDADAIVILSKNVLIPEIIALIHYFQERNGGRVPTLEELQLEIDANRDRIVAQGQAFLERTQS